MPDPYLPPSVYQGLGWSPVADPSQVPQLPPVPSGPPNFGGLPPSIPQGLGWSPSGAPGDQAPPLAPALPPTFTALPSAAGAQPSGGRAGGPDYQVPVSAFGKGAGGPPPAPKIGAPPPARPQSFAQGMANLRQREAGTEQAQQEAIRAGVDATKQQHADVVNAFQDYKTTTTANAAERKSESEAFDKINATNTAKLAADKKVVEDWKFNQHKYLDDLGVGGKVRWGIGMILAGIGQGMMRQGGPNPVLEMLQNNIHEANVAQYKQRDALVEQLGFDRQSGLDAANYHIMKNADIDKKNGLANTVLAKTIEMSAAKSADPVSQAAGLKASADARATADEHFKNFLQLQNQHEVQQGANAIAGGHLALAQQAERRAQKLQDLEYGPGGFKEQELGIKAAAEERKALKDQQQKVKDEGLGNPVTGEPLLTQQGRTMMAQADQLEAIARSNPAQAANAYVQKLRAQATTPQGKAQVEQIAQRIASDPEMAKNVATGYVAQIRNDAGTQVATIADPAARREVQDGIKWGQDLINTTAKIKNFLSRDPDITDREGWGRLQAEYGTAMVEYARAIGARASSRELDAISKHIMTYDPSSLWDRAFRKTPGVAALDGLQDAVKGGVDSLLKSHRIQDGWVPSSPLEQATPGLRGQTAQEVGAGEEPAPATRALAHVLYPVSGAQDAIQKPQLGAENEALARTISVRTPGGETIQKIGEAGLSPEDTLTVERMIDRARSAPNAERSRIAESLAAPIMGSDRPSLATGVLTLLKANDPALYEDVLNRLPKMRADEIRQLDAAPSRRLGADLPKGTQ